MPGNGLHHSDPLLNGVPDYGRELFAKLSQMASGHSADSVLSAAINLMANTLRETYGHRDQCEARIDELARRWKEIVFQFYDPVTNRRRSTIPFTQRVGMPLIEDKDVKL